MKFTRMDRFGNVLEEGDTHTMYSTCKWNGCADTRAPGFWFCADHLAAETERWLEGGTDADIGFDSRRLTLSEEDAQSLTCGPHKTEYGYTQAEHHTMVDAVVASGVSVAGWTWPQIIAEYNELMMAAKS